MFSEVEEAAPEFFRANPLLPMGACAGYPEALYHADPGFGSGAIKRLAESPAAFEASRAFPTEATDAMDFGSAFHMAILEPARYERHVVEMAEDLNFSTKAGKAFREDVARDRGLLQDELLFLKPDAVAKLHAMRSGVPVIEDALGLNPFAEPGHSEAAHFWTDRAGVRGKALIDRELIELPWLVDVKTTRIDLDGGSLTRYASDFGWPIQAAWYRRGVAITRGFSADQLSFVFIVFQSVPPFSVRVVPIPPETMAHADRLVERALDHYVELIDSRAAKLRARDPHSGLMELRYSDYWLSANGLS